ncbi:polysaccharide pyruvyl transferase family protein [Microbacterium mangrovi]|uniref:polysaccharide pyruvyl transferase family protein n=1 Tax=Microbacterium mangrovi TaxID=1348253 RepID=UPI00069047C5|nr:polysaccharide pyruvyl transferase family protein [Microbacterium mangrovi]
MNDHDRQILTDIRDQTRRILADAVTGPDGRRFTRAVVLDFPRYNNAGDSLIWTGTMRYLRELGMRVVYDADLDRFNAREFERTRDGAVVLFQGGGNLGDIYERHQLFRERIIPQLDRSKVVVLSQSIWFRDPANARRANRVFAEHDDLTLLVRDSGSLDRARAQLPDVRVALCPDLAFGNGELRRSGHPEHDYVIIRRDDEESLGEPVPDLSDVLGPIDWHTAMPRRYARMSGAAMYAARVHNRSPHALKALFRDFAHVGNTAMARANVASAAHLLSRGRVAVVDRLHAHILAVLLDIPHVTLDNSYGKISSIFGDYSGRFSTAHLATSGREQGEVARALLDASAAARLTTP